MNVIISPKAGKQLHKLQTNEALKITRRLRELESTPFAGKLLTGKLKNHYTLRAWPYRIVYQVFKDQDIILVDTIEHRQGVYK